jgi:glycosyltransferase involved in cell wall biosynthesis
MSLSICIVSREYPPDSAFGGIAQISAMEARALADQGHVVHVIALSGTPQARHEVDRGVIVHRLPDVPVGAADGQHLHAISWSMQVGRTYAELDATVRFDVLQVQDYYAEGLHIATRPETLRVARLHALSSIVWSADGRQVTPGMRAFAALEHVALELSDLVLAPTQLIAERTLASVPALPADRVEVVPPLFEAAPFAAQQHVGGERLRLLFLGRLEPLKGPDIALRALAAAVARGLDCQLTLVGREPQPGYRTGVLIPLMRELGLGFDRVRFVGEVDGDGVRRHLRHADCALLPSAFENAHTAALEAIASGVPAIVGALNGLTGWLTADHGLLAAPADDPDAWAATAAAALEDEAFLSAARTTGRRHVAELCDPRRLVADQAARYERLTGPRDHRPDLPGLPSMGIVMLAHNQLEYTQVAVRSVLRSTAGPFRLYVVDNASTDGTPEWLAGIEDDRVVALRNEHNAGVSGGRNRGIEAALADGHPLVAFLDNDVDVRPGWNVPFLVEIVENPEVGIVGERGVRLHFEHAGRRAEPLYGPAVESCDMVIGFCMVMRTAAVRQIGLFDENLGLFWHDDDDYGLRARRLGWEVRHVPTGLIQHFEHRSSSTVDGIWSAPETPSSLSERNQTFLAAREPFLRGLASPLPDARPITVLAFVDELIADPALLAAFSQRFADADSVTLLLQADHPPDAVAAQLQSAAEAAGVADAAFAADLLIVDPPMPAEILGSSVDAVLSRRPAAGAFAAPARFAPEDFDALDALIARRLGRLSQIYRPLAA